MHPDVLFHSAFLAPGVRVIGMYLPTNGLFTLACQIIKGTVDISTIMTKCYVDNYISGSRGIGG